MILLLPFVIGIYWTIVHILSVDPKLALVLWCVIGVLSNIVGFVAFPHRRAKTLPRWIKAIFLSSLLGPMVSLYVFDVWLEETDKEVRK